MGDAVHRLVVIEDNDGDVFLIKRALQEHKIPVEMTVCSDGNTAIRTLSSLGPGNTPHAIIMDLALPQLEGLDVLQKILHRPEYAGIPVMVFTSSPSPSDRNRVELHSGARYVQKPSGLDNFLRAVADNVRAMFAIARAT